jgi:hypothetical protein
MPRKSAASLAVVPLKPPPYPAPPAGLTKPQAAIWDTIVRCRPVEYFDGACSVLLEMYCRHADATNLIARVIEQTDPEDLTRLNKLFLMAQRETKALAMLSAKLRLAPQHVRRAEQVLPKQAHRRPWEWVP